MKKQKWIDGSLMVSIFMGFIGIMIFISNLVVYPNREIDGWYLASGTMVMIAFFIVAGSLMRLKEKEEMKGDKK